MPSNFSAVTSSWESITLTWAAGFDGGRRQSFTVTYVPVGQSSSTYDDVAVTMTTNETKLIVKGKHYSATTNVTFATSSSSASNVETSRTVFPIGSRYSSERWLQIISGVGRILISFYWESVFLRGWTMHIKVYDISISSKNIDYSVIPLVVQATSEWIN